MNSIVKTVIFFVVLFVGSAVVFGILPSILGSGDLAKGYKHPVDGTDHLLAMIAVGLLSVQMIPGSGNRISVWLVPLCFVVVLGIGGAIGLAGISLDWAVNIPFGWLFSLLGIEAAPGEVVILMSMVVLGLVIMSQARLPLWVGLLAVAFFAIYHGHAHGQEMGNKGALGYFTGFMLASAVIHVLGVVIGEMGSLFQNPRQARALAGAVLTGAGGYIMLLAFGWV